MRSGRSTSARQRRRPALALAALWLPLPFLSAASHAESAPNRSAAEIHRDAIVIDGHNDVAIWVVDFDFDLGMDGWEPGDRWAWPHMALPSLPWRPAPERLRTHSDLGRFERGGVDAQFFSVWPSADYYDAEDPTSGSSFARTNHIIDVLTAQFERHSDRVELALGVADVRRLSSEGKLAALLGVEGGHAIESTLENLRHLYARGARYMTLTWSFSHPWADASGDPLQPAEILHGGLTGFGREVVREMNALGMLVDVSHVSEETFWDTLEVARAPVIASHSSARAIASHPRNLSDDMLRAVAENGGVVMINLSVVYLDPRKTTLGSLAWDWLTRFGGSETSVAQVANHVEHVARVAGIDHVGIGSDFDGTPLLPKGLGHVAELPNLTTELVRRGYSEADVRRVLGENLLRALSEAERVASR